MLGTSNMADKRGNFKYYRNSEIHYSSDSSDSRGSSGEDNDSLVSSLDHGDREITQETVQAPSTAVTLDFQNMPPSRSTQGGSNAKGNVIQPVKLVPRKQPRVKQEADIIRKYVKGSSGALVNDQPNFEQFTIGLLLAVCTILVIILFFMAVYMYMYMKEK